MQENNSPPRPEPSRWSPLLLPALVMAAGLLIGLLLFMIVWRVPSLRAAATAFVLFAPRPFWLVIILLVVACTIAGVWYLVTSYFRVDEGAEQPSEVYGLQPRPHEAPAMVPQVLLPTTSIARSQTAPNTPIPETVPVIQPSLQLSEEETPQSKPVPLATFKEIQTRTVKPETIISITLLGEVTVTIHIPGGRGTRQVPINAGTKRAQLLAYLAARRGELIHRSKILYNIFAWRREDGTADDEAMGGHFHSHAKLLRGNIKEMVLKINEEAGEQLIDPDLDPFISNNEHWGISSICEVVDIEEVELQHKVIELARKDGLLTDHIPPFVVASCERLIASYPGDFIEDLIKKSPKDFKPWDGKASWAKKFNTHYRSCFLEATWLLGVFEEQQAQRCLELSDSIKEGGNSSENKAKVHQLLGTEVAAMIERRVGDDATNWTVLVLEELERQRRMYYGRAIEPFKSYALYACSTPYYSGNVFDEKVSYIQTTGRFGDRITASEQALRRCLKACACIGNTREANDVYSAYEAQMSTLFKTWGLVWGPSPATLDEWESVRVLTDAHRFSAQIPAKQAG